MEAFDFIGKKMASIQVLHVHYKYHWCKIRICMANYLRFKIKVHNLIIV